ncbi:macrophage colony-stimulating factor 1b isoform X1 [Nerophis ophidion]|uniref:macrophage colony-stimulating factor 1b isoform X1 n=2 Tax=Nerophis ophidion TaxID=159077 RepID=UPI002AE09D5D|nr:macrophage colony-stimulating factor 1b isoform X1 [Nerophis ophidion]
MTIFVQTLTQSKVKLQVKCLCVVMFLSFPLSMAEIPGTCRHSITREHLLTLKHLMDNQLRSGCSITYTFIEQKTLSQCCFVKAALPWILELLTTHFQYNRGSVNYGYVQSLRTLILNMYSQKCVPQINEEIEDKPESFEAVCKGSPAGALQRASKVLSVYLDLVKTRDTPIDWSCQHEYSKMFSSSTEQPTESSTQHCTDSYVTRSVKASQRRPMRDLYKFGFIITYIFGALLLIFTLFCLITQKRTQLPHRSGSFMISRRDQQDIAMELQ